MVSCLSFAAEASISWILEIKRNSSRRPPEFEFPLPIGFFLVATAFSLSYSVYKTSGF